MQGGLFDAPAGDSYAFDASAPDAARRAAARIADASSLIDRSVRLEEIPPAFRKYVGMLAADMIGTSIAALPGSPARREALQKVPAEIYERAAGRVWMLVTARAELRAYDATRAPGAVLL